MPADLIDANSRQTRLLRLSRELRKPGFRHGFMARQLKAFLAQQIRALRGGRSQTEFGTLIGKPQSVVSRIEKQLDKNISIQTLIDIATKLDIAVIIRFIDYPTFLRYTSDYSEAALLPDSYDHAKIEAMIPTDEKQSIIRALGSIERIPTQEITSTPESATRDQAWNIIKAPMDERNFVRITGSPEPHQPANMSEPVPVTRVETNV